MRKSVAISVRLEPELKEQIERIARADHRSVASLVEKVLADFVRERDKPEPVKAGLTPARGRHRKVETAPAKAEAS